MPSLARQNALHRIGAPWNVRRFVTGCNRAGRVATIGTLLLFLMLPGMRQVAFSQESRSTDSTGEAGESMPPQDAETQPPDDSLTDEQQADLELWKAGVVESTSRVARRTAATKLIQSNWPEATSFLVNVVQTTDSVDVVLSIADAIIESKNVPDVLLPPLLKAYCRLTADQREFVALAVTSFPPERAIPVIVGQIHDEQNPIEERTALIDLLSRFVEVETIDSLIPCLDESEPAAVRQAARLALESVTGETSMGDSRPRWQDWWTNHRNEGREGLLAASLARVRNELREASRREREVIEDRKALVSSLIRWIERAYALTPQDRRPALVVSLLDDKRQDIRALGLRLVERSMSNAEPVTTEVAEAVAKCFDDPSSTIRAEAARRLLFISAERAAKLAAQHLPGEESSDVRTAYFAILSRQPVAEATPLLVERYTAAPGRSSIPAIERKALVEAILASYKAHTLTDQAVIDRVAATALGALADPTDVTSVIVQLHALELELLAWSSQEPARAVPRLILTLAPNAVPQGTDTAFRDYRLAAARGFAASGHDLETLYSVANDPDVHPIAFAALMANTSRIESLQRVLDGFATPSPDAELRDITRIMVELPMKDWLSADDLLAASQAAGISLDQRAAWLRRVLDGHPANTGETDGSENNASDTSGGPGGTNTEGTTPPDSTDPLGSSPPSEDGMLKRAICIRLAELELKRGEPERALVALRAAPAAASDRLQVDRLRAVGLIAAGQFEAIAPEMQSNLSVWFDALDVLERRKERLTVDAPSGAAEPDTNPDSDSDGDPATWSAGLDDRMREIARLILDLARSGSESPPALSDSQRSRLENILREVPGEAELVNAQDPDEHPPQPAGSDSGSGNQGSEGAETDGG